MRKKERIVCGLHAGSCKSFVAILLVRADGTLDLIGTGYSASRGVEKGIIVGLEDAASAIRQAAQEAEQQAGITLDWVTAGITGAHIESYNCRGTMAVQGRNSEVTRADRLNVVRAAQSSVPIPRGNEILHTLTQEYLLDSRTVSDPVGMNARELTAAAHVVTCDRAARQNVINAVNRAGIRVRKVVLLSIACGEAVLTPEEKTLGSALVRIGGGTTDIALFVRDSVAFTSVITVGGNNFTRDLVDGALTTLQEAERLKRESGSVASEGLRLQGTITVGSLGGRPPRQLPHNEICRYLRARGLELMELVRDEIFNPHIRTRLIGGAVFTGGAVLLDGMLEIASEVLRMPVRLGLPRGVEGLTDELSHPSYAGALGLAMLEARGFGGSGQAVCTGRPVPLSERLLSWMRN